MSKTSGTTRTISSANAASSRTLTKVSEGGGGGSKLSISYNEYHDGSTTAAARKNIHDTMIKVIKNRVDSLLDKAPTATKQKAKEMMYNVVDKVKDWGNSDLYNYLAGDHLSDMAFVGYIQDIYKGKIKSYF